MTVCLSPAILVLPLVRSNLFAVPGYPIAALRPVSLAIPLSPFAVRLGSRLPGFRDDRFDTLRLRAAAIAQIAFAALATRELATAIRALGRRLFALTSRLFVTRVTADRCRELPLENGSAIAAICGPVLRLSGHTEGILCGGRREFISPAAVLATGRPFGPQADLDYVQGNVPRGAAAVGCTGSVRNPAHSEMVDRAVCSLPTGG